MVQSRKDGCERLRYTFRHNETDNTIEVAYSFSSGVLEHGGNIVMMRAHVNTLRYRRKQKGRNSEIDAIFDDPKKMAEVTNRAEQRFSEILGPAIEKTIQLLAHQALFEAGIKFRGDATQMVKLLTSADRRQLSKELGVKRGARKGVKQPRLRFNRETVEVDLPRKIRELRRHADKDPTRLEAARALGLPNAKALDRLKERFGDTRKWRQVLADA
jgi:hypothetical protein